MHSDDIESDRDKRALLRTLQQTQISLNKATTERHICIQIENLQLPSSETMTIDSFPVEGPELSVPINFIDSEPSAILPEFQSTHIEKFVSLAQPTFHKIPTTSRSGHVIQVLSSHKDVSFKQSTKGTIEEIYNSNQWQHVRIPCCWQS